MISKVKGTNDLYGSDCRKVASIENYLKDVATIFGYEEIRVPILSSFELIHRSSGESSDIVTKETFDFKDRGDRMLTLRPEGTAPVIRAVIENKLYANNLPLKLFYCGDMFRYERPQKGRYREFNQFGVEVVGSSSPYMDAEVITLASTIFDSLRISGYTIKINSLGDDETRKNYLEALKLYFSDKLDSLCEDCKKRFETNPLRILDCKVDRDSDVFKNAPKISDYLSDKSKAEFDVVKAYLDNLGIKYVCDEKLVRGLDYYTNTIFEFELVVDDNPLTICGGGRYNNLVKSLEGPDLPCVGFAFGMERLVSIIDSRVDYSKKTLCQVIPIGVEAKMHAICLIQGLRLNGFTCEINYEANNLKQHFKSAENNNSRFIIIIGDDELNSNTVKVKDKVRDTEEVVIEDMLLQYLIQRLQHECDHDCNNCNESCGTTIEAGCECDCGCHDHECDCGDDCDCEHDECHGECKCGGKHEN